MDARVAAPNRAHAFASALFEELARAGLRHVCVCPGSRSTPLVAAAVQRPELRCWSHLDERSAAFFALGLARASRRAVALVCTSGTAAANFHPAVIEAHYAGVPLLILTADRPPELRDWGAGQTIDQVRIYGSHVRWFAEAPAPEPTGAMLRHARALACRALAEAEGERPGPVHLNLPFREPLHPVVVPGDRAPDVEPADRVAAVGRGPRAWTTLARGSAAPTPELLARLTERIYACERGALLCGPFDANADLAEALAELARATGWPLFADGASPLRSGPAAREALAHADLFLRDERFAAAHAPELVLRVGPPPTSKALRRWIARHAPPDSLLLDPTGAWSDAEHLATDVLRVDPLALCERLLRRLATPRLRRAPAWRDAFHDAEHRSAALLEARVDAEDALLSPRAVRELVRALPAGALLYVSNSMPVRELDAFAPCRETPLRVLGNRGANGIDGMVSSALGAAAAGSGPLVLLTGDLAFLYDAGGLLAAHRHGLRATLVVLDNDGGGIFSYLPVAEWGEAVGFETHFRTPHGLDLGPVAEAYGARFSRVGSWEHFRAALKAALGGDGTHVIAVPVQRDRDVAHHRELERALAAALAAPPAAGAPR